jgi:hypothetical protein
MRFLIVDFLDEPGNWTPAFAGTMKFYDVERSLAQ